MFPTADQLTAIRNPGPVTKAWLETVRTFADYDQVNNGKPAYGDWGQHDLTLFLAGDESRAGRAADKIIAAWNNIEERSRNETREYTISLALAYEWLRPKLTGEQDTAFRSILHKFAALILDLVPGKSWGTRIGDSDEDVGHYFGFRLISRALSPEVMPEGHGPLGNTPEAIREEIRRLCKLASGGEWVESSEYNLGTVKLLIMGAYAIGIEEFPEVAAFLDAAAGLEPWMWTPDYSERVQWGDVQTPHQDSLSGRVALLSLLIGTGHDKAGRVRWLLDKITTGKPTTAYWFDLYRALWFFSPDSSVPAEPAPPYGFRDTGIGLSLHRGPDHLLAAFFPEPLAVDHQVATTNFQLWYKGQWILDSVRGYAVGPTASNACLLHGFGSMGAYGRVSVEGNESGCSIVWQTSGQLPYWSGVSWAPTEFVHEYTRGLNFDASSMAIAVKDSGNIETTVPTPEVYLDADKAIIAKALAPWQVIWHCPVEPVVSGKSISWKTSGGRQINVSAAGNNRMQIVPARGNTTGYINGSELNGFTCRFMSDQPKATITTTFGLADAPEPPPPVPPVPVPPPVAEWLEVARNVHEIGTMQIETIFRERKSPAGKG